MSMINHRLVAEKEREQINQEITRNDAITDEVIELSLGLENSREIIIDNLMFDYLIRTDEVKSLIKICIEAEVSFAELIKMMQIESIRYLKEDVTSEELFKMSWDDVPKSLIRINKRLILSKVKERYPKVYYKILERAKLTADKIIRGIV